jgi:CRISPR-associated protein Cas2
MNEGIDHAETEIEQDWLSEAFPLAPYKNSRHPPGAKEMLTVIAYDISSPKRLSKVAKVCQDFGVRVQYSVFECRLEADRFDEFWWAVHAEIDEKEDRVVAYKVCSACARSIQTAGCMVCSEKVVAYVF